MIWSTALCLFLALKYLVVGKLDTSTLQFTTDYFSYKQVKVIRSFTCNIHDKIQLVKYLHASGMYWTILSDPKDSFFLREDPYNWKWNAFSSDYFKFGIFMVYDCNSNKRIFNESSEKHSFKGKHHWLIWSEESYSSIEHARLNIDSEFTWATINPEQNRAELFDLYKINYTWPLIATPAGHWDIHSGLIYNITTFKYKRRENLQELVFDTAIAVFNPTSRIMNIHEHIINHEEKNYTTLMTKCGYAQLIMLQEKFNFRTKLHATETSNFAPLPNGSFQGQIGMMQRNAAKLSPSSLLLYTARDKAADFVAVTWIFDTAAMFIHPKVNDLRDALLQPFTLQVWMSMIASWLLAGFTLKIALWVETYFDSETSLDSSWTATMLATVGAISEQGYDVEVNSVSWRIVFLFMLIQVVLLNNYYGGGIVSSLLAEPEKTIKTVEDIIRSHFKVGYENVSFNRGLFQETNDPMVHELYKKKIHPPQQTYPNAYRVDIGIKKMKEEAFVFQTEQIGAYPFIESTFTDAEKCGFTEIPLFKSMVGPTYATIQKGHPYRELLTYGYRQIWEMGLMQYKMLEWRPPKPRCLVTTDVVSVEVHTISFSYYLLLFGVIVSVSVLALERVHRASNLMKILFFRREGNGDKHVADRTPEPPLITTVEPASPSRQHKPSTVFTYIE